MTSKPQVPPYNAYLWPIVERLRARGGSMTIEEMVDDVATAMGLSDEQRNLEHGQTGRGEADYRMAWGRTYLKMAGALENSERGVWRLTPKGAALTEADVAAIPRQVQQELNAKRKASKARSGEEPPPAELEALDNSLGWMELLLARLQAMDPAAFERLCQRLLRESGFTKVEVTGRSGDGGIDGAGVLRVNLVSFHVLFQSKRWSNPVGSPVVRDFRGAMVGRADKGLIITTSTFTADARREAVRDGAPAIDLIDGEALCDLLKQHRVGVSVRLVEDVSVDEAALAAI